MKYDDVVPVDTVALEVLRFAVQQAVTKVQLQRAEISVLEDFIGHGLRYQVRWMMAGRKGQTVSYPADWWQAVRERFAPAWWLKRFPVRRVTWRAWELLPDVKLPARLTENAVQIFEVERGA
jgi:hypothetical protein